MRKDNVLSGKKNFDIVYKKGKSVAHKYVVVFFRKNNLKSERIAFLASKKVGNAVMRNRARRLMKESIRNCNFDFTGYDVIFIARNTIKRETKCEDVKKSIISAIKKTKVLCR